MEQLFTSAAQYGGYVLLFIAAIKNFFPSITGWVTLIPTVILSGVFAWYAGTGAAEPLPLSSTIVLGVLIFGVAVGAWSGASKIAGKIGSGNGTAG